MSEGTEVKAKVLAISVLVLVAASCGDGEPADPGAPDPAASDPGVWRALPLAPVPDRPYAISAWTGTEALFWAGSSLRRDFAHTDGAAYDPAAGTWRTLPVPGWGHPGLAGAYFDGALYVAAKGGASLIDLSNGADRQLPDVPGFIPATMVATADAVWALGPVNFASGEPVRVGIARYQPDREAWVPGPTFDGATELGELFRDQLFVDQPVFWTGEEVIVWSPLGHGLAFEPDREEWRLLPPLLPPGGAVRDSRAAATGAGLAVLVQVEPATYGVASWDGATWTWWDVTLPLADFDPVTVAAAGDWLVVFTPDGAPFTVHLPSGTALRHDAVPIEGVQAPNAVWTGTELVVWGGVAERDDPARRPVGAVWTPSGS